MGAPLVIVGLDGATLDLIGPWAANGTLPNLARLAARGVWGRLRSTVPPATFPAWTSLTTGVNPGRHGVLDFTERVPGTYRVRFVNARRRRATALWSRFGAAGLRTAVLTVPTPAAVPTRPPTTRPSSRRPAHTAPASPGEVTIPVLKGLPSVEARQALDRVGLAYRLIFRQSQTAEPGTVIDIDPREGHRVPADTEITLVIAAAWPSSSTPSPSPSSG